MSEDLDPPNPKELAEIADELADVVRKALIEAAELKDIEERVGEISERIAKLASPPATTGEPPAEDVLDEPLP